MRGEKPADRQRRLVAPLGWHDPGIAKINELKLAERTLLLTRELVWSEGGRPLLAELIYRPSAAQALWLLAVSEAQSTPRAGARASPIDRAPLTRRGELGWGELLGIPGSDPRSADPGLPPTQRRRRVQLRVKTAIGRLESLGLLRRLPENPRAIQLLDPTTRLDYRPPPRNAVSPELFEVPVGMVANGWFRVLTQPAIHFLLVALHLSSDPHEARDGSRFAIRNRDAAGLQRTYTAAHRELWKWGFLEIASEDEDRYRRRSGRVTSADFRRAGHRVEPYWFRLDAELLEHPPWREELKENRAERASMIGGR